MIFSETFKRQKVRDILDQKVKILELSRQYNVSKTAIYKWLHKYSPHQKQSVQVVQMKSEAAKTKLLQSRVKELEAALGRKQLEADYLERLLDLASAELGYDLKKNFGAQASNGIENTEHYTVSD